MTISDRDRKILWARSGNKCSICKASLVVEKTVSDPAAVVGDEAHIVARSAGGPRAGLLDESKLDHYENLILLCKVDRKTVDDQPNEYTIERLHAVKSQHEAWVRRTLGRERAFLLKLNYGSLLIPRSVPCSWLSSSRAALFGKSSKIPIPLGEAASQTILTRKPPTLLTSFSTTQQSGAKRVKSFPILSAA
jgi:hypothetical protein